MAKGLRNSRPRDTASIMILRSETPQERELFDLFHRLAPDQQHAVLDRLREIVAQTNERKTFDDLWARLD